MGDFSHLSKTGEAALVDISAKSASARMATVAGVVQTSQECAQQLNEAATTEIIRTARLAAIQAAKATQTLIPLCHQIPLSGIDVTIKFNTADRLFIIQATAKTAAATGVEMEALCAASIAGATIYDMIKAVDAAAIVGPFQLIEKRGGKGGTWTRPSFRADPSVDKA